MAAPLQRTIVDVLGLFLINLELVLAVCGVSEFVLTPSPSTNSSNFKFCQILKFCMAAPFQNKNVGVLRSFSFNSELVLIVCKFSEFVLALSRSTN